MEEQLKKIVNFGIGAVKAVGETAQTAVNGLQKQLDEIIAKGEAAKDSGSLNFKTSVDELSGKVTEIVNNAVANLNDLTAQAQKMANDAVAKAQESVNKISGKKV